VVVVDAPRLERLAAVDDETGLVVGDADEGHLRREDRSV
jgi:hypothetical protein